MQGTISRYDESMRSGAVLTDNGIELPFGTEAVSETPVRFLRPGQRVRIETEGTGADTRVTGIRFITLP